MNLPFKRALVTGATGFVGQHLCQKLVAAGVSVYATGLTALALKPTATRFTPGDITQASFVHSLFKTVKPDVVFHLAAYGTFGHEQDVQRMIDVNIGGTRQLLTAASAANCQAFIQTGSIKEYAPSRTPITEEQPLRPWDDYAATKAAASFFCRLASPKQNMPITTLRLSPVYGPDDTPTRFVLSAIRAAMTGTPFTISVGSHIRNFTYIDDVTLALLHASTRESAGYQECNVAATNPQSFNDILTAIETATGKKISRLESNDPATVDHSWAVDNTYACRLLAWQPQTTLMDGIRRTVEWYNEQQASKHP